MADVDAPDGSSGPTSLRSRVTWSRSMRCSVGTASDWSSVSATPTAWAVRLQLVERFLIARLGEPPADDVPTAVWRRLASRSTSVDRLATDLGYSTRHLRRLVRDAFGSAPKRLAWVVRFHRTLLRLERDRASEIGVIALEHGYADQSHLARDVRAMAGTSPSRLRLQRAPVDVADSSSRHQG